MRKIILTALGILLIVVSYFAAKKIATAKNRTRPVAAKIIKTVFVDTIQNENIPIIIPANGNLKAKERLELYSEVQGVFRSGSYLFKPGQYYKKGQVFIRVDASEYYATVQSAKSNLYNSIAAIMPDLRLDFPDIFQKWQTYLTSFNLEKTTPKLPDMVTDKETYFITGRGIITNYFNVKNLEQRLAKYTITAPFSGILTQALVSEGSLIRNGQKLGEFINPSVYEMEVALSKTYASMLKVGEKVSLNTIDKTQEFSGRITRVNGSIDATTQTITAYIDVADKSLKEGMFLEANLNAKQEEEAIQINRNLYLDSAQIFIVKDSVLDIIDVKPVYFSDAKVVLKGVPNGTVILSKPIPGAYAGMLVKPYVDNSKSSSDTETPNAN